MTCLYCGKKLGFFSRYKDTPFCSEEHLRSHQDELEHALIERLGSKSQTPVPPKSGSPVPIADRPQLKKAQSTSLQNPSVPASGSAEDRDSREPAPLCDEIFSDIPQPVSALEIDRPMFSPASFAIIVQADCCTPATPDSTQHLRLLLDTEPFELSADSSPSIPLESPTPWATLPPPYGMDAFGEPWLLFPDSAPIDGVTMLEDASALEDLAYEAVIEKLKYTPLGQRHEISPRLRHRYPYAANDVSSAANTLARPDFSFTLTEAADWDSIIPSDDPVAALDSSSPSRPDLNPIVDVPLSLAALLNQTLAAADADHSGDGLNISAQALDSLAGLHQDCVQTVWPVAPALPAAATPWAARSQWRGIVLSSKVPPLPFPSLFQLGPVLPPRPELPAN